MYKLLDNINSPSDIKKLDEQEILLLNSEIREFLVENVTKTGGHLASNLGVVELSVALHRVFDTPKDRIIFDVGHQSYVHKIVTGRKDRFSTLRCEDGLSGFTKKSESEYDCFGAGHSSTAISAALGFAEADRIFGRDNYTIAVVGDGAFTGGMVYEALNNCSEDTRLIIVLNENEMSISKNVGNLSRHISKVRATKGYFRFKKGLSRFFEMIPCIGKYLKRFASFVKFKIKTAVYNLNFFENMGLRYLGPIDGNDYYSVETILEEAKRRAGNVLVHIKTTKGYGYDKAVNNPEHYHGLSPENSKKSLNGTFSSHMGKFLCESAERDNRICAITAAMCNGTGLDEFSKRFSERYFDVGIAESHAVTFFAGLSASGMKPVFAVYSTFLQRAYDNLLHDVSLQNLSGLLLIDRAGFATEDGATHHGVYDAAFLSEVPGITVYEPVSFGIFQKMMNHAIVNDGLFAIRYPKGDENIEVITRFSDVLSECEDFMPVVYGLSESTKNIIISYGRITEQAIKAEKMLADTAVILLQTISPLDSQLDTISFMIKKCEKVAFLEEGVYEGGVMMILRDMLCERGFVSDKKTKIFAIKGALPEQGSLESLYKKCGIACDDLVEFFKGGAL